MEAFGVEFVSKDLPLAIDAPKRKGCGAKGKWWYWLRTFRPDAGGCYVVGLYGSYKTGDRRKVEINWQPLADAERLRLSAERAAAKVAADAARRAEAGLAALGAVDLWRRAAKVGVSPYLVKKGVLGEACRYLPGGELVVPLLRYDWPRADALRGVQRIKPDGSKLFTRGFGKTGCAVRLGDVSAGAFADSMILICEGYATGLTLRMATERQLPVYVALDAGNLQHVVPIVRGMHPLHRILICADDDHRTRDHTGSLHNPGRTTAWAAAKATDHTHIVYPIFDAATRQAKDTDFNDLQARQGLDAVRRQVGAVLQAMRVKYG